MHQDTKQLAEVDYYYIRKVSSFTFVHIFKVKLLKVNILTQLHVGEC